MKKQKLIIDQLDNKLIRFKELEDLVIPPKGWIYSIRQALNMSMRQLGTKMGITPQAVKGIENREEQESISIKVLKQAGNALNMKFVYGFIPGEKSLEKMIEKRAYELARQIVLRTSVSMDLEDQKVTKARLEKAILEKTEDLMDKIPRYLWD